MDQIKFAVLGCNQGSKIARDAKKNEEMDLVAVAGFGEQAEAVAAELDVKLYGDYNELLDQEPLDAIAIALPNPLHLPATKAALAHGIKYILLEKPIANTVAEGEEIIAACEEAGATLLIGHHRRSSSKYQFLREFLDSGKLGKLVGVQSVYAIAKPHNYFDVEWHTKKGGGPLLINTIHDMDDLNFVTGLAPKRVYAAGNNTIRGNEVEDSVSVVVEYEGGVTASYWVSDGTPGPYNYDLVAHENTFFTMAPEVKNSMHLFGTEGSFGFPSMEFFSYKDGYGWLSPMTKESFEVELNDPMTAELEHFIDLIRGRETKPRCTGADGLATLKVINAVQESVDTHMPVDID